MKKKNISKRILDLCMSVSLLAREDEREILPKSGSQSCITCRVSPSHRQVIVPLPVR